HLVDDGHDERGRVVVLPAVREVVREAGVERLLVLAGAELERQDFAAELLGAAGDVGGPSDLDDAVAAPDGVDDGVEGADVGAFVPVGLGKPLARDAVSGTMTHVDLLHRSAGPRRAATRAGPFHVKSSRFGPFGVAERLLSLVTVQDAARILNQNRAV